MPVPQFEDNHSDRALLIAQQKEDKTLIQVREWARKQEKGYDYKEGVLVQMM